MQGSKADIIKQLQRQLEPVQACPARLNGIPMQHKAGLVPVRFPNNVFAFGAVHEFLTGSKETFAATCGFLAALLSTLMKNKGLSIWISPSSHPFPPALAQFNLRPEHIIFLHPRQEKDILWVLEEALKYDGLSAVIGELQHLSFAQSRRLQLAVENSGVMGMLIRNDKHIGTTACVSRWRISSLPSQLPNGMPGVGFACWQAELLRMRSHKPAVWRLEWLNGSFKELQLLDIQELKQILQTG